MVSAAYVIGEAQVGEQDVAALEKEVARCIKQVLCECEIAARMQPVDAVHPYEVDRRRKVIIRELWALYRKIRPDA